MSVEKNLVTEKVENSVLGRSEELRLRVKTRTNEPTLCYFYSVLKDTIIGDTDNSVVSRYKFEGGRKTRV